MVFVSKALASKILFSIFLLLSFSKLSSLPLCPEDHTEVWDDCFGSYLYDRGEMYSGDWKDNLYHGNGVFFYQNGDRYIGEWKKDIPDGKGTYTYKNGDVYVGDWKNGRRHGKGSYAHKVSEWESDLYVGEFRDNKKEGVGLFTFTDGVRYYGSFQEDQRHGKGVLLYLDSTSVEVECENDTCREVNNSSDTE